MQHLDEQRAMLAQRVGASQAGCEAAAGQLREVRERYQGAYLTNAGLRRELLSLQVPWAACRCIPLTHHSSTPVAPM